MKPAILKTFGWLAVFGACYLAGASVGEVQNQSVKEPVMTQDVLLESQDWGLGFSEPGQPPAGMASVDELKGYQAFYLGDTSQRKIYLTFDAGYENGNTEAILDALKKHGVKATFFVVGHYLETAPELV